MQGESATARPASARVRQNLEAEAEVPGPSWVRDKLTSLSVTRTESRRGIICTRNRWAEFEAAEVDGSQGSRVVQGPEATAVDLAAARERDQRHVVLGVHTLKEAGKAPLGPERAVIGDFAQVLRAGTEADEARHWEQLAAVEEQVVGEVRERGIVCLLRRFFCLVDTAALRSRQHRMSDC
eukprot:scaffold44945_cov61-Phaeocystis_antarctica.AAC.2